MGKELYYKPRDLEDLQESDIERSLMFYVNQERNRTKEKAKTFMVPVAFNLHEELEDLEEEEESLNLCVSTVQKQSQLAYVRKVGQKAQQFFLYVDYDQYRKNGFRLKDYIAGSHLPVKR
mmetsp:Transcript_10321/g.10303  ORF Transcript_10321/g.10303 Transcript_10321/m.10303 type:complete len:120 (-) Transcript_10321:1287-1646(-)